MSTVDKPRDRKGAAYKLFSKEYNVLAELKIFKGVSITGEAKRLWARIDRNLVRIEEYPERASVARTAMAIERLAEDLGTTEQTVRRSRAILDSAKLLWYENKVDERNLADAIPEYHTIDLSLVVDDNDEKHDEKIAKVAGALDAWFAQCDAVRHYATEERGRIDLLRKEQRERKRQQRDASSSQADFALSDEGSRIVLGVETNASLVGNSDETNDTVVGRVTMRSSAGVTNRCPTEKIGRDTATERRDESARDVKSIEGALETKSSRGAKKSASETGDVIDNLDDATDDLADHLDPFDADRLGPRVSDAAIGGAERALSVARRNPIKRGEK